MTGSKKIRLTESQAQAVTSTDRNLIVSAGAGTGKTRVLVERFLHLIESRQALAGEILTLTFTEKAALEMKRRILERLSEKGFIRERRDFETAYISTIHAFASRILREHPLEAGIDPEFRILEQEEAGLLKEESLDQAIETGCGEDNGIFLLLKTYGEKRIRKAVDRVFDAARTEGHDLKTFFGKARESFTALQSRLSEAWKTMERLSGEIHEAAKTDGWQSFQANGHWDHEVLDQFKEWYSGFGRRGGTAKKHLWQGMKETAETLYGLQADQLTLPYREAFERLVLQFEGLYETRKQEEAFLDFDDLEKKAVQFFLCDRAANRALLERYRRHFKFIMVDEFQDTNFLQSCLVSLLSSGDNLFFVGDSKQSIYGFRGTSPQFFYDHEKRYGAGDGGARLALLDNFRSTPGVLSWINPVFRELWAEEGILYEDLKAAGVEAESGTSKALPVEWIRVDQNQADGETLDRARMREAGQIARHILTLTKEGFRYGDIALLFQSMKTSGIYEQALKNAGIPYFVVAGRGFYHQSEIRDVMSLLTFLDNPRSDISLAAVLRSPFVRIKDDTLFWLAHHAKKECDMTPLFEALEKARIFPEIETEEKEKLEAFASMIREFLLMKDRMSLADFLETLFERTGYETIALADPKGIRRYANLRKLVELARRYETHEKFSLTQFVRLIRILDHREARESEAPIESETGGEVVRLMTIHAAKGLEFPAVILPDLAHQNSADDKLLMADPAGEYALQFFHPKERTLVDTYFGKTLWMKKDRLETEEWKRLFYVAVTRAEKRLVLSGVFKPKLKPKTHYYEMSSWMDWLCRIQEQVPEENQMRLIEPKEHIWIPVKGVLAAKKEFQALLDSEDLPDLSALISQADARKKAEALADEIEARIAPLKPAASRVMDLPVSAYVTFVKSPEEYWTVYELGQRAEQGWKPSENTEEEETALSKSDFGTLIHGILEHLDWELTAAEIEERISFFAKGLNARQHTQAVKIIQSFLKSPLCGRLKTSKRSFRELPFLLNERHGRIQGVMDLLYQDPKGDWHLVDYKTAAGDPEKLKQSGYELQLRLYALALKEILGVYPETGTVYFLENEWSHSIALDQKAMDGFPGRVRALQEEILSFTALRRYNNGHVL